LRHCVLAGYAGESILRNKLTVRAGDARDLPCGIVKATLCAVAIQNCATGYALPVESEEGCLALQAVELVVVKITARAV
jgi:hypothetical protein